MDTFVLMNKFKNSQTTYRHCYYLCIFGDVSLTYHPTKFGDNCKSQCGYMDKTVKKLLTGGRKSASSLKMDLDGELVVERN